MSRASSSFRALSSVSLLLFASTASAANYSGPVNKSEWATSVPDYIDMFIALPDNMPESPPIIVNIHSCGNSAGGQWGYAGFAPLREAIDSIGYIMIVPQQSRNCWNVGAPESLTHGGGGDTGAIVQMVEYAIATYNADPTRVYAMGGSGGGMAVQALLAVYPEVFKAGHARAGVTAGCWAEGYDDGQQWSNSCAGGSVDKTPQEWGDFVRAINPSYTGPYPRLQINQGNADATISFNNFQESIDEWTNVYGIDLMPTSTDSGFQGAEATYDRQFFEDACGYTVLEAWEALGMGHSMGYESVDILRFFGLDQVREQDPWDEQCGDLAPGGGGAGGAGTGGAGMGEGGMGMGMGGAGAGMGGMTAAAGGMNVPAGGMSAASGTGPTMMPMGSSGMAGVVTTPAGAGGPNTSMAGAAPTGAAAPATGSAMGMAGAAANPTVVNVTQTGAGNSASCSLGARSSTSGALSVALLALGFVLRRRRDR